MKDLWDDDLIQFARLLCEIRANVSITSKDWKYLKDSMDLEDDNISEIFDRANIVWEQSKRNLFR